MQQPTVVEQPAIRTPAAEAPQERPRDPITMKSLLESGVHFGHQTRRWNPKMKSYIFTERNGIHILDLQQTMVHLERAARWVTELVTQGGTVLFVGTKKQAQETIASEAQRCGMFYINQRWLGGTLTNWQTIKGRIDHMNRLEEQRQRGEFRRLPKQEAIRLDEKIQRLNKYLGGVKQMKSLPGALFIIDLGMEKIAVAEGNKTRTPIVALVDTDCDPNLVSQVIPGNDDAIRSIRLVAGRIADAALQGLSQRQSLEEEAARAAMEAAAIEEENAKQDEEDLSFEEPEFDVSDFSSPGPSS